jgi:hypothetical protein
MKTRLMLMKIILLALLLIDLFFWAVAYGSGHKLPVSTNLYFSFAALLITGLLITVIFGARKIRR